MKAKLLLVAAVVAVLGWFGAQAEAAWPSGGLRVIGGKDCTQWFNFIDDWRAYCPFVSDSDSYYGADNSSIYVDYQVSGHSSGDDTSLSACRQSWTGSAVGCGTPGGSNSNGNQDVLIDGYGTVAGSPDVYDSFHVQVITTETVDNIWGLSHQ